MKSYIVTKPVAFILITLILSNGLSVFGQAQHAPDAPPNKRKRASANPKTLSAELKLASAELKRASANLKRVSAELK
ncbi:MAG TPA: hypothetical protein VK400_00030 [Pyrinomonadaceae bacterium]|nr:hypothetical protein [Pyrinomonadaceae bacterium]